MRGGSRSNYAEQRVPVERVSRRPRWSQPHGIPKVEYVTGRDGSARRAAAPLGSLLDDGEAFIIRGDGPLPHPRSISLGVHHGAATDIRSVDVFPEQQAESQLDFHTALGMQRQALVSRAYR